MQLTRQNLLKHEKMKNGTPPGLADKSVPAREHLKIELLFRSFQNLKNKDSEYANFEIKTIQNRDI